jgi:hypothetical protein
MSSAMLLRVVLSSIVLGGIAALVVSQRLFRTVEASSPEAGTTLEELLEQEWGDRWQTKREDFLGSGHVRASELAGMVDVHAIIPWRSVEPKVVRSVLEAGSNYEWLHSGFVGTTAYDPDVWTSSKATNPSARTLDGADAELLIELLHSVNAEMSSIADEMVVALQDALYDTVEKKNYLYYPANVSTTDQLSPKSPMRFRKGAYEYYHAMLIDGWAIVVDIDSIDYPRLDTAYRYLKDRRHWRMDQVSRFLSMDDK